VLSAGITGHVQLDDNLDRLGEYRVWHKPSYTADYQPFVDIKMKSSQHHVHKSSQIDDIVMIYSYNKLSSRRETAHRYI